MSTTAESDESFSEQRIFFILAALMFFAIPVRFPDPETRTQREFRNFIITFNRTYYGNATEYEKRYQIFKNTFDMIEDLRQDNRPVFGINRYSDMSGSEFRQRYLQTKSPQNRNRTKRTVSIGLHRYKKKNFGNGPTPLPLQVDWRNRGIITAIRNQGEYGSCYAQSVIATVEAMRALKWNTTTTPEELSIQQMIDSNHGGDTCHLLQWLKDGNITILPERNYRNKTYNMTSILVPSRVTDYTCYSFVGQEPEMLAFLAFKGPLIASVNALPWKQYVGGVIKQDCNGPPNHAVQIVGYNLSGQEEPHYIVRNSWGTGFGHGGYAKIAIGGNVCGIAEEVASVTVD